MCLFCASKPFGFAAASLTRRSFVSHSLALGSAYAAVRIAVPVAVLAQNATADMIIENAKIITLDPRAPRAEAIAIAGDKIIGVGARRILGVLEKVHKEVPIDKLRWGLEHGEGLTVRTLERIKALNGSLGLQNRMSLDGEAHVEKWGKEAAENAPAFGRIREMGIPFALGTDGNRAASHNPWAGVQWLVTGKTQGGLRHQAEQNLMSREDALRAYSASGAWISTEEDKKGTLSVGKWADLAVLSDDYLTVPEDKISELSSVLTMVGGRIVYADGTYAALAPPAAKAAPDWLPINAYPGYRKAERADHGIKLAAAALSAAMPTILGADGRSWMLGCGCGLL
jgi:hypothetical protein